MAAPKAYSDADVIHLLRSCGINPTQQRILITRALFARGTHVAAEDLFRAVNEQSPTVSKATVYNTLGLLARTGIVREVIADPARVFYDPNTSPHHHFFDEVTGELTDIDASEINISNLPVLPPDAELRGVDVVIRVRRSAKN